MEELEAIVQRMIDAGESEENIKLVIEEYERLGKTNGVAATDAAVTPQLVSGDTELASDDTSSELLDPVDVTPEGPRWTYNVFGADVSITQEEQDRIVEQANQPPTKRIERKRRGPRVPFDKFDRMVLPETIEEVEVESYVYDDFLNKEKNNQEEAKQLWIADQRVQLLREKLDTPLEDFETEIKPWYSIFDNDLKRRYRDTTYAKARAITSADFKEKEQEANKRYSQLANKLTSDRESIENIDLELDDLRTKYEKNPELVNQEVINNYNNLLQTRKTATDLFNKELEQLNAVSIVSQDFNTIADLTQRTYNNIDIGVNRIRSTVKRLGAGLADFSDEVSLPGFLKNVYGIDVENEDHVAALPKLIQPIANEMGRVGKERRDWADKLTREADKINQLTAHRQELKKINNINDFGLFVLDLFSEQAINTAVTYSTGGFGLGVIAAGAGGNKFREMNLEMENGQKYSPLQFYAAGMGYGFAEYITEKVTLGQAKGAIKALKDAGNIPGMGKYTLNPFTTKDAVKRYGIEVNRQGSTELFASLGQNFLDKYTLDKDVSLADNLLESYVSGAVLSGLGFQAPVIASDMYRSFTTVDHWKKTDDNAQRIIQLRNNISELNKKKSNDPQVKEAIATMESEINTLLEENLKIKQVSENRIDDLSAEDKHTLIHLTSESIKHKKQIDKISANPNLTQQQKDFLIIKHASKLDKLYSFQEKIRKAATFSKDKLRSKEATIEYATLTGVNIEDIVIEEGDNAVEKVHNYIDASNISDENKNQFKEEIKEVIENNPYVNGFHTGSEFGLPISLQFEENATEDAYGNETVFSHELGHATVFRALAEQNADMVALSKNLEGYVKNRFPKLYKEFEKTHRIYKGENAAYKAEETLAMTLDFMRKYDVEADKSLKGKLIDSYKNIRFKYKDTSKPAEVKTGEDVYNMLKSFAFSFEAGKISELASKIIKGEAEILKAKEPVKRAKTLMSKQASDKVQEIYNEQGEGGMFDIFEQFKPITTRIARRFREVPGYDEQLIIDEIETGKRGMLDLIREYKPESGVPLAAYINKFLPSRSIEAGNRILKTEFEQDITEARGVTAEEVAEPAVEASKRTQGIKLTRRLGEDAVKINERVKEIAKDRDFTQDDFKTLKDLTPELTQEMFGIVPKVGNLTRQDTRNAQMFIAKHADTLLAMLPKGATAMGTSTGVQKVLLDAFYTKTDRAKAAKTGSRAGLAIQTKKPNITRADFLSVFGITEKGEQNLYKKETNTSSRIKALVAQTGRMLTNQAVREQMAQKGEPTAKIAKLAEGKADVMFSKQGKDNFIKRHPNLNLIDLNPTENETDYNTLIEGAELLAKYIGPGFIRATDLYNFGINNKVMRDYARKTARAKDDVFVVEKGRTKKSVEGYLRPDTTLGKRIKDITEAKVDKYNRVGRSNFEVMWKGINKAIKDNPNNKSLPVVAYFYLASSINDTSHPNRTGALMLAFDKTATGEILYEHALQSVNVFNDLLDAIVDPKKDFKDTFEAIKKNYYLIAVSKNNAKAIDSTNYIDENGKKANFKTGMGPGWSVFENNWYERYFNKIIGKNPLVTLDPNNFNIIGTNKTFAQEFNINSQGDPAFVIPSSNNLVISENISNARSAVAYSKDSRGMSTFDFDETLIVDGKNFVTATKGDDVVKIPSNKWPIDGPKYAADDYNFDFSDFAKVRGGKEGPLLQKMKNQIKKYGPKNVFVLTARMQEAAEPIHKWLKSNGITIPIENITGLGRSEGDAKAAWFLDKYAEGYNDMYFVDDALPNVKAVKHIFDQLDIKGKSVQAKVKFSKELSPGFNKMIERTKGVGAEKTYSRIGAQKRGKNIGRFEFFVPPSAEDFSGLLRYFVGKGKQGDADIAFFKKALIDPFAKADEEMKRHRQTITNDYKALRKELPKVKKKLGKMIGDSGFTFDNAIRVYLWDKAGFEIPGLSKRDIKLLVDTVNKDADLKTFADAVGAISKQEDGYVKPGEHWSVESIASDLQNVVNKVGRKQYLAEWIENKNEIFTVENLNKIEAIYGSRFREALENILWRMENGTNRPKGQGRLERAWTNWVNNSVGAIMFFNMRSAVLQTLSTVNFINFQDNNIFAAAKAFANQKQYWKDFAFLFNSDFLKQRRAGLELNVNEAEIASAVAGATNKAKAAVAYLLKIGFIPTQAADSFAIASGGATYYRNRVKKYVKEGMDQKAAEKQAMVDFMEIAEETQQSARPDRISQQQASGLGRLILAFGNTPMQYNRLIKKAAGDLINKRGDYRSNISRIVYYGAIQSFIFSALQSAIFALAFDDEEDDEQLSKKAQRTLNGMVDSILRGSGLGGAAVSAVKNTILEFIDEEKKGFRADYGDVLVQALNVSPPIGSKARKLYSSTKTYKFNKDVMGEMNTFDLENPLWGAVGNIVSATTNVPLDRGFRKIDNIKEALNQDNETWQRIAVGLGWDQWSLGIDSRKEVEEARKKVKEKKKEEKKKTQQRCTKIKSDGFRCKVMVKKPKKRCHYHD